MTREIILGNGVLTILADPSYKLKELYYPSSTYNHLDTSRIGFWKDGAFKWLHDLQPKIEYLDDSLVSKVSASFNNMEIEINDAVDLAYEILVRKVKVKTNSETRIFFTWDFHINESIIGDTCLYDPNENGIIHYKRDKWFLYSCDLPIFQYATGYKEEEGYVGTWKDCEDGELSGNPIAQGSVDSAMSVRINKDTIFYCWLVCGTSYSDVKRRNEYVKKRKPNVILDRTKDYWKAWLTKIGDFDAFSKRSALILAASWQNNGAIPASLDTDILRFNRDTYNYVWHRDAAFCAIAFSLLGYLEYPRRLFSFSKSLLHNGFFFQKYTSDGYWGSTWHPWLYKRIPIQEDETALMLYALWIYFKKFFDIEFIKELYRPFIKAIGDFLADYIDEKTGLPLPSYDIWEERYGTHFYTTATVYAGLISAAKFADFFREYEMKDKYLSVAKKIKKAIDSFYNEGHFARSLINDKMDLTADSSTILGALLIYNPTDERTIENRKYIEEKLKFGGIARYEHDSYLKQDETPNAWFITTSWLAQQYIAEGNLEKAKEYLKWIIDKSLNTGIIPEQVSQSNKYPSVSPLSWSHAELLRTIYYLKFGYKTFLEDE